MKLKIALVLNSKMSISDFKKNVGANCQYQPKGLDFHHRAKMMGGGPGLLSLGSPTMDQLLLYSIFFILLYTLFFL